MCKGDKPTSTLEKGNVKMKKRTEELKAMTVKELLAVAKQYNVVGRHDMKKDQLIESIVAVETKEVKTQVVHQEKTKMSFEAAVEQEITKPVQKVDINYAAKKRYEETAKIGIIVAFRINENAIFSGKIVEIHSNKFVVQTKSGSKFTVDKKNIVWYKTGKRWPKSIYEELVRRDKFAENKRV